MPGNLPTMIAGQFTAFNFESITIDDTSGGVALTTAILSDSNSQHAKRAFITVEDASIRWRYDGGTPTSSIGHLANRRSIIIISTAGNLKNFRAIRTGNTDAIIRCTYEY